MIVLVTYPSLSNGISLKIAPFPLRPPSWHMFFRHTAGTPSVYRNAGRTPRRAAMLRTRDVRGQLPLQRKETSEASGAPERVSRDRSSSGRTQHGERPEGAGNPTGGRDTSEASGAPERVSRDRSSSGRTQHGERPEGAGNPAGGRDTSEASGAPERIRTSDLRLRRPTLYPAELRALKRVFLFRICKKT